MKSSEAAKVLAILRGAYPDAPFPDEAILVYETMMSDLGFEETQAAVAEHIATSKWFPKICEIREKVVATRLNLPSTEKALRLLRAQADVPELVREAVNLVGGDWERRYTNNPTTWRAQFRTAYEALRRERVRDENVTPVLANLRLVAAERKQIAGGS